MWVVFIICYDKYYKYYDFCWRLLILIFKYKLLYVGEKYNLYILFFFYLSEGIIGNYYLIFFIVFC